ncbi:hypothetical protein [Polaromonas sp. CG9_12]|nr:hypothetical protein [Polaromonas sp. CG9_12]
MSNERPRTEDFVTNFMGDAVFRKHQFRACFEAKTRKNLKFNATYHI